MRLARKITVYKVGKGDQLTRETPVVYDIPTDRLWFAPNAGYAGHRRIYNYIIDHAQPEPTSEYHGYYVPGGASSSYSIPSGHDFYWYDWYQTPDDAVENGIRTAILARMRPTALQMNFNELNIEPGIDTYWPGFPVVGKEETVNLIIGNVLHQSLMRAPGYIAIDYYSDGGYYSRWSAELDTWETGYYGVPPEPYKSAIENYIRSHPKYPLYKGKDPNEEYRALRQNRARVGAGPYDYLTDLDEPDIDTSWNEWEQWWEERERQREVELTQSGGKHLGMPWPYWKWSFDPERGLTVWEVNKWGSPSHGEVFGDKGYNHSAQGHIYPGGQIMVWPERPENQAKQVREELKRRAVEALTPVVVDMMNNDPKMMMDLKADKPHLLNSAVSHDFEIRW